MVAVAGQSAALRVLGINDLSTPQV